MLQYDFSIQSGEVISERFFNDILVVILFQFDKLVFMGCACFIVPLKFGS